MLADNQEADVVVPVVVGIVPIDVHLALAGILVQVKIAELTVCTRRIVHATAP